MSRFFATGSDSESEESSSADEITPKASGTTFNKQVLLLSDDEEDTKRIVRSAKDKRFEELTNLIKTIRNAMKIRDMSKCLEEFEQLCRAFNKSKTIVDKEGVPQFYVRLLADLEDYLNQLWEDKEGKKKMNKNNAKALSTLRQKIRKYNKEFETEIASYKENPEQSADEEEEKDEIESGSSSESDDEGEDDGATAKSFMKKKPQEEEKKAPEASKFLKGAADEDSESDDDDDDDDEHWGSDSVDSGSDSDDNEGTAASLAVAFLKKTQDGDKPSDRKKDPKKKRVQKIDRLVEGG